MYNKSLPPTYYHDHFLELLHFFQHQGWHLCGAHEQRFIDDFLALPKNAQCVLVRGFNRKSDFLEQSSLHYDEIEQAPLALALLKRRGWLRHVHEGEFEQWLVALTKAELVALCRELGLPGVALSKRKEQWLGYCQTHVSFAKACHSHVFLSYVVHAYNPVLAYLCFIFFGRLQAGLGHFSLRDLGIMRTQQGKVIPRFDTLEEAKSAFTYAQLRAQVSELSEQQLMQHGEQVTQLPSAIGALAERYSHEYLYRLGKALLAEAPHQDLALSVLAHSEDNRAIELLLRQRFKKGHRQWVEQRLCALIDDPPSDEVFVFAEDFYALKYQGKRTSVLSDLLAEKEPLAIDEAYRHQVEQGVIDLYTQRGEQALHSENQLWQHLFALCFWHLLFDGEQAGRGSEFDVFPASLRDGQFYHYYQQQIRELFAEHNSKRALITHISAAASRYYHQPNAFIRWHEEVLAPLVALINHAPLSAVYTQLETMAKDFRSAKDGYPDLMVITSGKVRFEEIKAPGDSLRRNQLVALKQLQRAGFDVSVQTVRWQVNSEQPYVIVDIETTGGRHQSHRITEVAAIKVVAGKEVARWHSLVNPQRHIPRAITELTGIDNVMVADAPVFAELSESLWQFMQGCIFVAHNVNFDYGFLKAEFARTERHLSMAKLCTVRLGRSYLPGHASYSLARLSADLDIALSRHHRAMSDAEATVAIFNLIQQQRQE